MIWNTAEAMLDGQQGSLSFQDEWSLGEYDDK